MLGINEKSTCHPGAYNLKRGTQKKGDMKDTGGNTKGHSTKGYLLLELKLDKATDAK